MVYEDDDLLVVNKPPGWNTHSPAPYAGEGVFDWLRHREPRWAGLGIVHRLDKETSGLMVFGRTPRAHRELTDQFSRHRVVKRYTCLTDRPVQRGEWTVISALVRAGDRYRSRPLAVGGLRAETRFRVLGRESDRTWIEAEPLTGRTHQIRVHASESGIPLLGDSLYGGSDFHRLALHSSHLAFNHPNGLQERVWTVPADFSRSGVEALRSAVIHPDETNAFRLWNGASDDVPGWQVDVCGYHWLAQTTLPVESNFLPPWILERSDALGSSAPGLYLKHLRRDVRSTGPEDAAPVWVRGPRADEPQVIRENGVSFEISFQAGYSIGLFLDQRENRRRLARRHIAAGFSLGPPGGELLNTYAYTCAFSVCGAIGGAKTTSLDLSRKYLDWGRRNFALNGLNPDEHDFIYGDTFDWLKRLGRRGKRFDTVVLDPPTFSRSREHGDFRAEQDYGRLVTAALAVLRPGGVLLASTNASRWAPEDFLAEVRGAALRSGRTVQQEHYVPQPVDFPISREQPAYLKTVWLRLG